MDCCPWGRRESDTTEWLSTGSIKDLQSNTQKVVETGCIQSQKVPM